MRRHRKGDPAARILACCLLLAPAGPARAQGAAPALHLPGAGAVTAVVETPVRDGFDQRIQFAGGDGRNHAEIALRNETGDLLLAFPPRLSKPSQFGIEGEIAVRFPGQPMRVLAAPRRNAYGPVGLALGPDCLYAWQWFERPRAGPQAGGPSALFGPLPEWRDGRRALSLRIRLCRTERASLGDLVGAVERMAITLPAGLGARSVPAVRRSPAPPRVPLARSRPPAPQAARPAQAEPPPRSEPRSAAPPQPVEQSRIPAPPPPQPSPADTGRRYLAPTGPEAGAPAAAPAVPSVGGPQRYITDGLKPAEPPGPNLMPSPAPGRATGESLSRDLPAEAYQPPANRGP
ncbi:cellulose biosynthesis protein BcsN [Methylobacterium durans]|uniref:cellulose biosynthesis protein BcsN n=1 Tax=Methylobacterium durans TaxID=2202825 RepID=UPI002AFFA219|nr:cellulose biosynthesis protein BcsN [Methylobacterium durans]MEA1833189.1 cellulose biosynthesis protein BcsN [Methylobacterium durans]